MRRSVELLSWINRVRCLRDETSQIENVCLSVFLRSNATSEASLYHSSPFRHHSMDDRRQCWMHECISPHRATTDHQWTRTRIGTNDTYPKCVLGEGGWDEFYWIRSCLKTSTAQGIIERLRHEPRSKNPSVRTCKILVRCYQTSNLYDFLVRFR